MTLGLLAHKRGMTQYQNEDGEMIPVTVLEAGPCTIIATRSQKADGYDAVQLAFAPEKKKGRITKAMAGHFAKAKVPVHRHVQEFRGPGAEMLRVGTTLTVAAFTPGEKVDIQGRTKGKGFQGVIKRHHKGGGPASHGSHFHRSTGSIGMNAWPAHTLKGMKMPGQMGDALRTTRNLEVVAVDIALNLLLIKGAVPGSNNGLVRVETQAGDFATRFATDTGAPAQQTAEAVKEQAPS